MSSIYKIKCDVCLKEWEQSGDNTNNVLHITGDYRYMDDNEKHVCFDCVADPNVLVLLSGMKAEFIKKAEEKVAKEIEDKLQGA